MKDTIKNASIYALSLLFLGVGYWAGKRSMPPKPGRFHVISEGRAFDTETGQNCVFSLDNSEDWFAENAPPEQPIKGLPPGAIVKPIKPRPVNGQSTTDDFAAIAKHPQGEKPLDFSSLGAIRADGSPEGSGSVQCSAL